MYPATQKQAVANLFEDSYLNGLVGLNILKRPPSPRIKEQFFDGKSRPAHGSLKTSCKLLWSPFHKLHFPTILYTGCVFKGFQLCIVVWEFIEQDGDWHAVENNSKWDAGKCKNPAQRSLWKHVAIAHSRDAHLWKKCIRNKWVCQ